MAKREGLNQSKLREVLRELDLVSQGWEDADDELRKEKRKRIEKLQEAEEFYKSNIIMTLATNMGLTEAFAMLAQHSIKIQHPEIPVETYMLSLIGQSAVVRLIREENLKRRRQWVEIVGPIIGAITGLLAVIVALVALLIKR